MATPTGADLSAIITWINAFLVLEAQIPDFYRRARNVRGRSKPSGKSILDQFTAAAAWMQPILSLAPSQSQGRSRSRQARFVSTSQWQSDFHAIMNQANIIGDLLVKYNLITAPAFAKFVTTINDIFMKSIDPFA